jgi:2'-5' RNA ligase
VRRQLTLFVPAAEARALEALRARLDPVQRGLIAAHVTLCREDELADLAAVRARLASARLPAPTLTFAAPEVFDGHGLLLRCVEGREAFRGLRERVLGSDAIRDHAPHLTLAHPRNPRAPGNALLATPGLPGRLTVTFREVRLIEQDGARPWVELERFALDG